MCFTLSPLTIVILVEFIVCCLFVPGMLEVYCRFVDGFLSRGRDLILPGFGGTSTLARAATLALRWLYELQPIRNPWMAPVGVSTPCGAISTRRITVFVPGLLELCIYGRNYGPGMGPSFRIWTLQSIFES